MGLFLAASGIIGANRPAVEQGIAKFAVNHDGTFERCHGTTDDPDIAVISGAEANTTVLYPQEFVDGNEVSQFLSQELQKPVFSFHIHDGDLWMFILFNQGQRISQFNPVPDYWEQLPPHERAEWSSDANVVSRCVPGIEADSIQNYLVEWTDDLLSRNTKAYPEDECEYGVDWQMADFMQRIGLTYPVRDDGTIDGQTYRLQIR